jgi:thioredoxin 1
MVFPITDHQSPITDHQSPITDHLSPITDHQSPITDNPRSCSMFEAITDADFAQTISSPTPVLVDFWAEWCGPCKRVHAMLESLADEWAGRLRIVSLDVGTNPQTPAQEGILNLPSLVLYRDGKALGRWGALSGDQLKKNLERLL